MACGVIHAQWLRQNLWKGFGQLMQNVSCQLPEINYMDLNEFEEYSLSDEDKEIVDKLNLEEIQKIDEWLRSSINYKWQKVAKVVASAIMISEETGELLDVPDVFFGIRIEHFEAEGEIVSRGNIKQMRYSEIKYVSKL